MTRLFLGLSVDEAARQALFETARALSALAPGRYLPPSRYHVTLAFLGETDEKDLPRIRAAMEDAARGAAPFAAALSGAGMFGTVLWRGVRENGALFSLAGRVRAALRLQGISFDEKPFRAHITLARDVRPPAGALPLLPEATLEVRALTLFESARQNGALLYVPRMEVRI